MDLLPGASLGGRYIVESVLGRGGFATVYAARHVALGTRHAVKVLHAEVSQEIRDRAVGEGRMQARLQHPNVVRVTDVVELDGAVALVMDPVEGETLAARLARGPVPSEQVGPLLDGLFAGVAAAHAAGLVHRDLKPDNVLLGADGAPRITDFGLARAEDPALRSAQTRAGVGMGTPGYMAPEAFTDVSAVDARADIYALGAIAYELLGGRRAFGAELAWFQVYARACQGRFTPLDALEPGLPAHVVAAVHAALDPDPDARPATVVELARRISGRAPAPAPPPPALTISFDAPPPAPASEAAPPHHLPAERDEFIGRDAALAELDARLLGARLVSVLGIGGAGKTRLVTRYAWSRLSDWPGGVWFCELAEAVSVEGICYAVAQALDVPLGAQPVVQLGHAIAGRGRALIVLDNFEQLTAVASATLGRWLDRAAEASFLVTSRERLGLPGESVLALEPLDEDQAIALFLARARAAKPDFSADREALVALVRRLEGLPLAIELMAARARVLSPAAMLARLSERFRLLASAGGRPTRHLTLRAMLDWSWALLTAEERAGLAQLSVFSGGFSLEAAEEVLEVGGAWVADVVAALVDKSLVRRGGEERYELLDSVAEYAAERLDEAGWRAKVEARHGAYFARFGAQEALDSLDERDGAARRAAMAVELDNLAAAVRRAAARGEAEVAVSALSATWALLWLRGPFSAGIALAERVLAMPLGPAQRAAAEQIHARALRASGQNAGALVAYRRALSQAREVGDRRLESSVLGNLGNLYRDQGRLEEAREHYQAALQIRQQLGHRGAAAIVSANLGLLAMNQGALDEAASYLEGALATHRETGNRRFEGITLGNLGGLAAERGDLGQAAALFEAALVVNREVGDRRTEGIVLSNLASISWARGQMDRVEALYERSQTLNREVGNRRSEGLVLGIQGGLALERGDPDRALTLIEAGLAVLREVGDRRLEGSTLGALARVWLARGELDQAWSAIELGERLLRQLACPLELSGLLCARASLEIARGRPRAARAALREAELLADHAGPGSRSELGRTLARARAEVEAVEAAAPGA